MTENQEIILAIMADGQPRTSAHIHDASGLDITHRSNLASTCSKMTRTGMLRRSGTIKWSGRTVNVYVINPDYVVPKKAKAKREAEKLQVQKRKAEPEKRIGRLVTFRNPAASSEEGTYAYKPQPAQRPCVRFGGISSLEVI